MSRICQVYLAMSLIFVLAMLPAISADTEAVCKRLVEQTKAAGGHNHPEYYTGKHGFMNEVQISGQGNPAKGLYIMSWLVLDPPLTLGAGGGVASINKDLYKDYFGVSEVDVSKSSKNYPFAGLKSTKPNADGKYMFWTPINFLDLVDAKQGNLFASGNQFDWAEWGGQGLNQFHEYLFCLVKWDKDTEVTIKVGSDDPEVTWVNGVKVAEGLADRDFTLDQDTGKFTVKAGQWNAIFVEVGENGGECGFMMRVEPAPSDHTLDTQNILSVGPVGKAATTWAAVKEAL